jgi:cysteine desulfurase family protein (TIGR01976 family)
LPDILNRKTRLIAVTLASNAVGTIVDIGSIVTMAHDVGALVYVDAVHNTPHNPIDVQALNCDFLAASAYKFFGPHTGVLYGKYELLDKINPYKVRPAPDTPPGKWETGTQSFESLAGVEAAVTYLESILGDGAETELIELSEYQGRRRRLKQALTAIKRYEESLSFRFLREAAQIPGLRVYGITDVERLAERAPTFSISMAGLRPRQIAERLGQQGIFVWDGHYYAVAVMDHLGTLEQGGLTRIGFVHYNTAEEVDRLVGALYDLAKQR